MTVARIHGAVLTLLLTAAVTACSDAPFSPPVEPPSARFDGLVHSNAPLVQHLVSPSLTDPAIDRFLDDHYVWLDTSARSNHTLLVLMPGSGQRPAQFQLVQQEAARLGYHVIGLAFVNTGGLARLCPATGNPAACFEGARLETLDGIDRTPVVDVNPPNGIYNRLGKVLTYLASQYPEEGWEHFLADGSPKWQRIAVSGLSNGGAEAAMIAKTHIVARVIMFSSVTDSIGTASVPWVPGHVTPVNRYFGLAHMHDGFFAPIQAGWDSLGMTVFGPAAVVETSDPPYGWSHMLITDLLPRGGFVGLNAHASTATDAVTPLAADGTPLLRDAWDYLLTGLPRRPGIGAGITGDER